MPSLLQDFIGYVTSPGTVSGGGGGGHRKVHRPGGGVAGGCLGGLANTELVCKTCSVAES